MASRHGWRQIAVFWPIRLTIVGLLCWVWVVGGTWGGIANPAIFTVSRGLIGIAVVAWVAIRTRAGWAWHRPALWPVAVGWVMAIGLSAIINLRQESAVGAWFVGVYILVYWMVVDLGDHLGWSAILDGVLIAAWPVVACAIVMPGYRQIGTLENANYAGAFMAVIAALAFGRRWWALSACASVALLATGSRGGVLALGASMGWAIAVRWPRWRIPVGFVAAIGIAITMNRGDWTTGRSIYWADGLARLADRPIAGYGLFTYRHVDYLDGSRVHWHPHSLPIHTGAELGAVGLGVLALSACRVGRCGRWRSAPGAVVVGMAAASAIDVVMLQPGMAVLFVVVVAMATEIKSPAVSRAAN